MSSPTRAQQETKPSLTLTIEANISYLGFLVGMLWLWVTTESDLIAAEQEGADPFAAKYATMPTMVLTSAVALAKLASSISPSIPIDQLLATVQSQFLIGIILGLLTCFSMEVCLVLMFVSLFCMKTHMGESRGEETDQRERTIAVASLIVGMMLGQMAIDATLGFQLLMKWSQNDNLSFYSVVFVAISILSASTFLQGLVSGIHQGGNHLLPSDICYIFFLNLSFGCMCALIVRTTINLAMGLPHGVSYGAVLAFLCLIGGFRKWGELGEREEDPFLAQEHEEGRDMEDVDSKNNDALCGSRCPLVALHSIHFRASF